MHLFARRWALCLIVLVAACGKDSTPPDTTPAAVTISPAGPLTIASGATQVFTASVTNKGGEALTSVEVSWTTSNAATASNTSATSSTFTGAKVGTASITASVGTAPTTIVSTPVSLEVTAGAAAKLAMKTQPGGAVSGQSLSPQPAVEVQDLAGNPVTTSTASIVAAIGSGGGTLSGTATMAAASGVATFTNLVIRGATAARTLSFTSTGLTQTASLGFTVTADPTPAVITVSPSAAQTLVSGATVQLTATVKNADSVTLAGSATWVSKDTAVATVATSGLVSARKVGTTKVVAKSGSLTSDSVTVTVTPGAAAKLAIRTQPAGAGLGAAFTSQPVIEVQDANSNIVTSSTANVTAAILTGTGTLTGTTTIAAVAGVATYTNLAIATNTGSHTIRFTSTALASVTSNTIVVSNNPPTIVLGDSNTVFVVAKGGANSPPRSVTISNLVAGPMTGLSRTISYGAGGTGWLSATFGRDTTPTAITLVGVPGALTAGVYTATVTVSTSSAVNQPVIPVSMTVGDYPVRIQYGDDVAKIIRLNIAGTSTPTQTAYDATNAVIGGATYTFVSRSPSVATVSGGGVITAAGPGEAFVVASVAGGASDSVYVQVVPATGPVMYTDLTKMKFKLNDVIDVKVFLDMRGATLGSANFFVNYPYNDGFSGFLNIGPIVDGATALGTQTLIAGNGQLRATAASATGASGVVEFMKVTFTVASGAPRSKFLVLVPVDIAALDYSSLTSSVTALRYPMVIIP